MNMISGSGRLLTILLAYGRHLGIHRASGAHIPEEQVNSRAGRRTVYTPVDR